MLNNILGLALSALPKQKALLFRWLGRETNDRGLDEDNFAPPVEISGSIQPVDRSRYGYMGLDASKTYITVYTESQALDLGREHNPDQLEYQGRRYRIMGRADWRAPAGFNGLMAEEMGAPDVPDGE